LREKKIDSTQIKLIFKPVSKSDGGKTKVLGLMREISEHTSDIRGLIDWDLDPDHDYQETINTFTLPRYAIENCLLEPVFLFFYLREFLKKSDKKDEPSLLKLADFLKDVKCEEETLSSLYSKEEKSI